MKIVILNNILYHNIISTRKCTTSGFLRYLVVINYVPDFYSFREISKGGGGVAQQNSLPCRLRHRMQCVHIVTRDSGEASGFFFGRVVPMYSICLVRIGWIRVSHKFSVMLDAEFLFRVSFVIFVFTVTFVHHWYVYFFNLLFYFAGLWKPCRVLCSIA